MRLSPDCAFCRSYGVRVPLRWSHPIDLLTPHGTSKNQFADNRKAPILDRKPLHSDDSNHESIANHQRLSHSSPQRFPRSDLSRACCRLQSFLPLPPPNPSTDRLQSLLPPSELAVAPTAFDRPPPELAVVLQSFPLPPERPAASRTCRLQSLAPSPELPAASRTSRRLQSFPPPPELAAAATHYSDPTPASCCHPTDRPTKQTYLQGTGRTQIGLAVMAHALMAHVLMTP